MQITDFFKSPEKFTKSFYFDLARDCHPSCNAVTRTSISPIVVVRQMDTLIAESASFSLSPIAVRTELCAPFEQAEPLET